MGRLRSGLLCDQDNCKFPDVEYVAPNKATKRLWGIGSMVRIPVQRICPGRGGSQCEALGRRSQGACEGFGGLCGLGMKVCWGDLMLFVLLPSSLFLWCDFVMDRWEKQPGTWSLHSHPGFVSRFLVTDVLKVQAERRLCQRL